MSLRLSSYAFRTGSSSLSWTIPGANRGIASYRGRPSQVKSSTPKSAPPVKGNFPSRLPRHVPQWGEKLLFELRPQDAFTSFLADKGGNTVLSLERFYHLLSEFQKAAKRACNSYSKTWEADFLTDQKASIKEMDAVCSIFMKLPDMSIQEEYLLDLLMDTTAQLGSGRSTMLIAMVMLRNQFETRTRMFPRAEQRMREFSQRNPSPDALTIEGLLSRVRGDKQAAIELLRRAMGLGEGTEEFTLEANCAVALGSLLHKEGKKEEALNVLEAALKHDTPGLCFETASVLGFDDPHSRLLLVKAAASGHVEALKHLAELEAREYEQAVKRGGADAREHFSYAMEWRRISDAYKMKSKEEALQYI